MENYQSMVTKHYFEIFKANVTINGNQVLYGKLSVNGNQALSLSLVTKHSMKIYHSQW